MKQRSSLREQQAICGVGLISVNGSQMLAAYHCLLRLRYGQFQTATVSLLDTPAGGFLGNDVRSRTELARVFGSSCGPGQTEPSLPQAEPARASWWKSSSFGSSLSNHQRTFFFFCHTRKGSTFYFRKLFTSSVTLDTKRTASLNRGSLN